MTKTPANRRLANHGTSIFALMGGLARSRGAINLAQGFPDENAPPLMLEVARQSLERDSHQYAPLRGVPELRESIARHDKRFYGLEWDPDTEIIVTSGAMEALSSSLFGLLNPGDEVVIFEPAFETYRPIIELCGATPKIISLNPPDWHFGAEALRDAITESTSVVILNSPMNPSGKVFSMGELEAVAEGLRGSSAVCLCDEVYEHVTFDGVEHIPLASLPDMQSRCIRVSAASKTFSVTGWRVGFACAEAHLLDSISRAHQFTNFSIPRHLQMSVAAGLDMDDEYYLQLRSQMERRRNLLRDGLTKLGFKPASCKGSYFINADYSDLGFDLDDFEFAKLLTTEAGVAAIPISAFRSEENSDKVVRFCFCKNEDTLKNAIERLADFLS